MTDREFFVYTVQDELPRFDRLLQALPNSTAEYRPHEKARSAAQIVNAMAREASTFPLVLKEGSADFANIAPVPALIDMQSDAKQFLKYFREAGQIAASMGEQDWNANAQMLYAGKVEWETTRGKMAWAFVLDMIHHRGQLSVYIRPMGGHVPSIYGPSGDTEG